MDQHLLLMLRRLLFLPLRPQLRFGTGKKNKKPTHERNVLVSAYLALLPKIRFMPVVLP